MDLFAIGHQGITGQRVEMLPAGQLPDAPYRAVDGPQAGAVAHAPDHALVVGRGNLAATLDQRAVGIEQQLRVVQRAAIAFVDADGHDHARLPGRSADGIGGGRRHGDRLVQQLEVFGGHFERRLHVGKVRVVRHDGFREHGELHALLAEFENLLHHFVDGAFTAVKNRADLYGGGFDEGHGGDLIEGYVSTRSRLRL
ncbi:hypothetical protein D3C86_1512120 [compost metagenome]